MSADGGGGDGISYIFVAGILIGILIAIFFLDFKHDQTKKISVTSKEGWTITCPEVGK